MNKYNKKEYQKQWRKEHPDYDKIWQKNNPDKVKKKKEKYDNQNRELINKKACEYRLTSPEKIKSIHKKFRDSHKQERAEYHKQYINSRRKNDEIFRLKHNMQIRTYKAFKNILINKNSSTFKMIGLTPSELKKYIESKFIIGMSWNNYGDGGWEIDHIFPLSLAKNENHLIELCHYTNLQPLWKIDNIKKGNKII